MSKKFKASEFMAALAAGDLKNPIIKTGLVKEKEGSKDSFFFAEGFACDSWVEIPLSQVEEAELVTNIRCKDHTHWVVKLFLKEPDLKNPVARLFAELARQPAALLREGNEPRPIGFNASSFCQISLFCQLFK